MFGFITTMPPHLSWPVPFEALAVTWFVPSVALDRDLRSLTGKIVPPAAKGGTQLTLLSVRFTTITLPE